MKLGVAHAINNPTATATTTFRMGAPPMQRPDGAKPGYYGPARKPTGKRLQLAGALMPGGQPPMTGPPADDLRRRAMVDALDAGMTAPIQGDGSGWDWAQGAVRFGESALRSRTARDDRKLERERLARELERQNKQDAWQTEQQGRQRVSWGEEDRQRAARDAYIAGLSPDQQAVASAAPDVAIQSGAERAFARPEQVVSDGFVWTKNPDGTLTRGEEVPLNAEQRATTARALSGRGEATDSRYFSQGQGLADDFRMQVKPYQDVADTGAMAAQYARQLASGRRDPSMEGALLMKIAGGLQSGVLSDNDIRTASGGTLPTNIMSLVDSTTGKGRLSQPQIQGLLRVAQVQDQRARQRVQAYADNVRGIARARNIPEEYIFGVDPMLTMFGPPPAEGEKDDTDALLQEYRALQQQQPAAVSRRPVGAGRPGTIPVRPGGF